MRVKLGNPDAEGHVTFFHPSFTKTLGYTADDTPARLRDRMRQTFARHGLRVADIKYGEVRVIGITRLNDSSGIFERLSP